MDRWDDLRVFLAVARTGTLSAGAERLGLSISTAQRRVMALEKDLDSVLFEKAPRGYRLSNTGEALLPRAEEVEEAVLAAVGTVVGHDQRASGDVRLTLPVALSSTLSRYLAAFAEVCEGVRPILLADDGLLDLGRSTDVALRAKSTEEEGAVAYDLCGIAWCRYSSVEDRTEDLPWITYLGMDDHPAIRWRLQAFPSPNVQMVVAGVLAMQSALESSLAQGLLPCFLGDPNPALRRIGDPVAENRLWLFVHAELRRSARVRALTDFLVPQFAADRDLFEGARSA